MTTNATETLLANLATGDNRRQKAHLTFRGNTNRGRHGWLRLTPAYSLHVVNEILEHVDRDKLVLDPFSGTATTTLASVTRGIRSHSVDINPFLVWLGNLKLQRFPPTTANDLREHGREVTRGMRSAGKLRWTPSLHQIEKWWTKATLVSLSELFARIGECDAPSPIVDLLKIAFCRVMIGTSNVSFGHQSMSFKKPRSANSAQRPLFSDPDDADELADIKRQFLAAVDEVVGGLASDAPTAEGKVIQGDSRQLDDVLERRAYSTVITSPPYPNRMSYIRELRPYMYWLGFLESGRQAGEMDWQAIGGTWGCATSNLNGWQPRNGRVAYPHFDKIVRAISQQHELLGKYVQRYFDDIKLHLRSLLQVMAPHGQCFYIVGNSKFYDTLLPVEEIYAALFEDAGFKNVGWKAIRKRNSKKELFEYVVYAEAR
jgi:hypothetical protein